MDKIKKVIQGKIPCCLMFVDDIVLVEKNMEEVNNMLDEWKLAFEGTGLVIARNKTDYDFGGRY